MEELQEKINLLTSDKDVRYFYHFTSSDGNKILEDGLVVANPKWEQSFLEFSADELNNIESIILDNQSTKLKDNNIMIIAGVYKDGMDNFIRHLRDDETIDMNWSGVGNPDYIVDNEHLLGYIDLETLELSVNEYANALSDDISLYL